MAVFLQEDGQLALGSKTPVSILQEFLQKKGITPHYELIYNGVETNNPIFKFRVSAEELTAIGDGKSKKEAKHDAAASLLKRLLTNETETSTEEKTKSKEVDIASPYTGALKTNYVGMLDDICFSNKIPYPNYVPVREEGPPHARVFTMRCDLSSISEIAVARTKKQAKHLVAQKMIGRLSNILKDRFIPALQNDESAEEVVSDREAIKNGTFHHDLTHKVGDLHNVFHLRKDEHPLPSAFQELPEKPEEFYESMEKPLIFLEEVVEALEGIVKINYLNQEEFQNSLKELVLFLKKDEDECEEELGYDYIIDSECENQDEPKFYSLSDFPLSDEEEEGKGVKVEIAKDDIASKLETQVDDVRESFPDSPLSESEEVSGGDKPEIVKYCVIPKVENKTDVEDAAVYSFIKVEVPWGFWDFVGRGGSKEESLDLAARQALKFLRTMAVPPLQECL